MEESSRDLHFNITGEFVTKIARDWYFKEHKPYNVVKEFLLGCMWGTDDSERTLEKYVLMVLNGDAEFRGNTEDNSYSLVILDKSKSLIKENFDEVSRKLKEREEELESINKKYIDLLECLNYWGSGDIDDAVEAVKCVEDKRLVLDVMKRYGDDVKVSRYEGMSTENSLLDNFLKASKYEDNYGWLSAGGEFTPVDFGYHEIWANEYVVSNGLEDRYERYREESMKGKDLHLYKDFLVYEMGFVLLENPTQGLAIPTYKDIGRLTKRQKEFLFGYYQDRGENVKAKEFIEDGI